MKLRLGAIGYLNTRPLIAGLEQVDPFELSYGAPALCASQLREGQVDLGLIPSIEYARSTEPYCIVPQVAIACRGAVLSVRLFYRGELARVGRVALDQSSRTSAALLQILLHERYSLAPQFVEAPPDLDRMLARADAALLIGDAALETDDPSLEVMDLGQEWRAFTGLPFVFAFWAGRAGAVTAEQAAQLVRAREHGQAHIPEIARAFAQERRGQAALYEHYLRHHIHFELGQAELAGLHRYYELAWQHGLISQVPELRFYETKT